jgi:hypothetical protein
MDSLSTLYRVDISAAGMGGAAPADGFIDQVRSEIYLQQGTGPTTLVQSLAKRRANVRYRMLRESFDMMANLYTSVLTATGASGTTPATTFSMTLEIERGDSVLSTADELNAGQTLSGAAAIKRCIARAMIVPTFTKNLDWYDPTQTTTTGNATIAVRNPFIEGPLTVGQLTTTIQLAEAVITVTKIANT